MGQSAGKTSYFWTPCHECKESPWPGILFPTADGAIEACDDCCAYSSPHVDGGYISDDEVAAKALLHYLRERHGFELTLEWGSESGWFFVDTDFHEGFRFYKNFRAGGYKLHPNITTEFATWWDEKKRKEALAAYNCFGPMSKDQVEAEEDQVRDENVRLWHVLRRTRKHRDKMMRNLRNELIDARIERDLACVERNRVNGKLSSTERKRAAQKDLDKLHSEINGLRLRREELKAAILMMGGDYK